MVKWIIQHYLQNVCDHPAGMWTKTLCSLSKWNLEGIKLVCQGSAKNLLRFILYVSLNVFWSGSAWQRVQYNLLVSNYHMSVITCEYYRVQDLLTNIHHVSLITCEYYLVCAAQVLKSIMWVIFKAYRRTRVWYLFNLYIAC